MEERKDNWDITVKQLATLGVVFDRDVTATEAGELFMKGRHSDVIDEEQQAIISVVDVS